MYEIHLHLSETTFGWLPEAISVGLSDILFTLSAATLLVFGLIHLSVSLLCRVRQHFFSSLHCSAICIIFYHNAEHVFSSILTLITTVNGHYATIE